MTTPSHHELIENCDYCQAPMRISERVECPTCDRPGCAKCLPASIVKHAAARESTTPASHPAPPEGCTFFEHSVDCGWMFTLHSRQQGARVIFLHSAEANERYAAACVATVWTRGELERVETRDPSVRKALWALLGEWEAYLDAARAEMEAINDR